MLAMLLTGIAAPLFAQRPNPSDQAFEVPGNVVFTRKYYLDLGSGNHLQIRLTALNDLDATGNIDSLLQAFLTDVRPLRDSFNDPLASRRIDYVIDADGRKKIRLQQHAAKGSSYLMDKGTLSALRTQQDTINILGIISHPLPAEEKISGPRYFEFSFYLNSWEELTAYMGGILDTKISRIEKAGNDRWPTVLGTGFHYMKADPSITADKPKGYTTAGNGDLLELNVAMGLQNYKDNFVPSFSLGAKVILVNRGRSYKWETGLYWEPQFVFARDAQNRVRTYRNDFLTLTYGQGGVRDHDPAKAFSFSSVFSLGYLVGRSGSVYENHTFRLGAGRINLAKTAIEPCMYFNDFFRGVTPGIRINQYF